MADKKDVKKDIVEVKAEIQASDLHSLLCTLTDAACNYYGLEYSEGLHQMSLSDFVNYVASLPPDRVLQLNSNRFNDQTMESCYVTVPKQQSKNCTI